jgi:CBS domain-containing protein
MSSSIRYPHTTTALTHRRRPVCAAEPTGSYRTRGECPTDDADEVPADRGGRAGAPDRADTPAAIRDGLVERLPVIAEVPELAGLLTDLEVADAAMRRAVVALGRLDADFTVEQATGVGLEHWLALACRHTRLDRRTLLRTARWTVRLPAFGDGLVHGRLSWAQARTLTLTLRDLPAGHDEQADQLLASLIDGLPADADPDAIVEQLRRAIFRWQDTITPESVASVGNRLVLQPRLDGTGGTFHGDTDAVGLALLDDATAPTRDQLDHPGGITGARADNLLSRVAHTCADRDGDGGDDHTGGGLPPVQLLARLELDTALDTGRLSAELLTRLLGGRLQVTTAAARRLLDTHGTRLRTVLVDNGTVVGVGRATRTPPRWLTDTLLAIHDTCTGPVCDRPARGADIDHAAPWWPIDDRPGGATDLDQLGPLCSDTNQAKEAAGWRAHQQADGLRRWRHPRTGLTTTSIPTTWRPPGVKDPPDGHDPPGDDGPRKAHDGPPGDGRHRRDGVHDPSD